MVLTEDYWLVNEMAVLKFTDNMDKDIEIANLKYWRD